MSNLPIEDGLRGSLIKLAAKHASSQEQQSTVVLPLDHLVDFIHHYATKRELELELKILKRIESMGDGEAHRQGSFSAHNMDDFHRAYGEIVAHNVHERIAELKAQKEQESK